MKCVTTALPGLAPIFWTLILSLPSESISNICSWKVFLKNDFTVSDWGHSVSVVVTESIKNNILCPTKKGRSLKNPYISIWKKGKTLNSSLQTIIPAGLCSLFFSFWCFPQACISHILLCTLTSDHQGQGAPKQFWWLVNYCHKKHLVLVPSPPHAGFNFLYMHQKDFKKGEKKLAYSFQKEKAFKIQGQTQENNELTGALAKSGYGCQRYGNILKVFFCCLRER